jgi:peptidoglycan hydrolase-like protein with peptidoglycan-binding domain
MIGLDYASVDGNTPPDWRAAKKAGVGFVIQRASFSLYNKYKKFYSIVPDPHIERDWDSIKKAKLIRGAYMFPEPRALASPEDQVATFAASVEEAGGLKPGDFPPVLDIEYPDGLGRGLSEKAKAKLRRVALEWMIEAANLLKDTYEVWPMLYTSARVWDGEDNDSLNADTMLDIAGELVDCPLWLARYPAKVDPLVPPDGDPPVPTMWGSGNYWIWQYYGDAKKVPGFSSTVDMNKFNFMRIGATGDRVKWVQKRIGVKVDGGFGAKTEAALCAFQKRNGLTVDGVVGPGTFAHLAWVK